jgi:hypothetical protein
VGRRSKNGAKRSPRLAIKFGRKYGVSMEKRVALRLARYARETIAWVFDPGSYQFRAVEAGWSGSAVAMMKRF